jgi:triosephosphate isomerase
MITDIIRPGLAAHWGEEFAQAIRVLYGGSVNPGNARGYLNQVAIDGALIGGASLTAEKFLDIIETTQS